MGEPGTAQEQVPLSRPILRLWLALQVEKVPVPKRFWRPRRVVLRWIAGGPHD